MRSYHYDNYYQYANISDTFFNREPYNDHEINIDVKNVVSVI